MATRAPGFNFFELELGAVFVVNVALAVLAAVEAWGIVPGAD